MSFLKEIKNVMEITGSKNKESRQLMFYSENKIYSLYWNAVIDAILEKSDLCIAYITSDATDPMLTQPKDRIKPYYIDKMLAFCMPLLDCKALVMTMPDLNQFHIKRSNNSGVNHVYIFHAIMSTHMAYRKGAFDHYDTIFCVGPHHVSEIRRTEELYDLKPKTLVEVGYPWLEKIYQDHQEYLKSRQESSGSQPTILVAPSWSEGNILESCVDDLVSALTKSDYRVVVRPHPEFIKRSRHTVERISKAFENVPNFELELELTSGTSIHQADVLITDWSGIAFEYAFGTERPVLFINTPRKVNNPEYESLGIEPLEVKTRGELGRNLDPADVSHACSVVSDLIDNRSDYGGSIRRYRQEYIFNWQRSAEVGAEAIVALFGDRSTSE